MVFEPKLTTSSAGLPATPAGWAAPRQLPNSPPGQGAPSAPSAAVRTATRKPTEPGASPSPSPSPAIRGGRTLSLPGESQHRSGHHRGTAACCSPDGRGQSGPASLTGRQRGIAPSRHPGQGLGGAGRGRQHPRPLPFPPGPVPGGRRVRQRRPPSGRGGGARLLTNLRSASGSRSRRGWRSQTPPGGCHPGPARGLARGPLPAARAAEPGQRRSSRPEPGGQRRGAPEVAFNSERRELQELQGMRGWGINEREKKK